MEGGRNGGNETSCCCSQWGKWVCGSLSCSLPSLLPITSLSLSLWLFSCSLSLQLVPSHLSPFIAWPVPPSHRLPLFTLEGTSPLPHLSLSLYLTCVVVVGLVQCAARLVRLSPAPHHRSVSLTVVSGVERRAEIAVHTSILIADPVLIIVSHILIVLHLTTLSHTHTHSLSVTDCCARRRPPRLSMRGFRVMRSSVCVVLILHLLVLLTFTSHCTSSLTATRATATDTEVEGGGVVMSAGDGVSLLVDGSSPPSGSPPDWQKFVPPAYRSFLPPSQPTEDEVEERKGGREGRGGGGGGGDEKGRKEGRLEGEVKGHLRTVTKHEEEVNKRRETRITEGRHGRTTEEERTTRRERDRTSEDTRGRLTAEGRTEEKGEQRNHHHHEEDKEREGKKGQHHHDHDHHHRHQPRSGHRLVDESNESGVDGLTISGEEEEMTSGDTSSLSSWLPHLLLFALCCCCGVVWLVFPLLPCGRGRWSWSRHWRGGDGEYQPIKPIDDGEWQQPTQP
jgi:hypothetical protein